MQQSMQSGVHAAVHAVWGACSSPCSPGCMQQSMQSGVHAAVHAVRGACSRELETFACVCSCDGYITITIISPLFPHPTPRPDCVSSLSPHASPPLSCQCVRLNLPPLHSRPHTKAPTESGLLKVVSVSVCLCRPNAATHAAMCEGYVKLGDLDSALGSLQVRHHPPAGARARKFFGRAVPCGMCSSSARSRHGRLARVISA